MIDPRLQYQFLQAAAELVLRQGELLPRLEEALGVDPYDYWIRRSHGQPSDDDPESDGEWRWWFHGIEVELFHERDGRRVRVDFGPDGRRDAFTAWGVGIFVCGTKAPWRQFPELRAALDDGRGEPRHRLAHELGQALLESGALERAKGRITVVEDEILAEHLTISEVGRRRLAGDPRWLRRRAAMLHKTI